MTGLSENVTPARFGCSDIRWFPILTCALVADADVWYSVSTGTNEGSSIGIGFFAVFAIGAFRKWCVGRDPFHLVIIAGAAVALCAMVLRKTGWFDPCPVFPYLVFILFCVSGSILSHFSKRGKRV